MKTIKVQEGSIETAVLEKYFDEKVTEIKNGYQDYYIHGHWYQVRPTSFMDMEDEEGELGWIKDCPVCEYEGIEYYIIEQ